MKGLRRHAPDPPDDAGGDVEGAEREARAAERELRRVRSQASEVSNVSRKLRDLRERNHFAEMINEALGRQG